ncbi:cytochrome P450 [Streptomyces sp. NPDC102441]|uniref:cytochrome P450 n=1 Tax=Streptomyces sp. NPDC102441 TaxID=3366176 RepID=UPI00381F09CA
MTETLTGPDETYTPPEVLPYDPFDPSFHADPYTVFEKLRAESGQVIRTPAGVALLGHDVIQSALRDPRLGRGEGAGVQEGMMPTSEGMRRAFFFMDPPDHTRVRALASKAFTPRLVERLRPPAEKFVAERLAAARETAVDGVVDLMPTVLRPLSAYIMNQMMGVPDEYLDRSIEAATDGGRGIDPEYAMPPEAVQARTDLRIWMGELATKLIAERREEPREDLISALVAAEQDGDRLSEVEVLTTTMAIFLPGFSAPQAMMGLCAFNLLRHPEQLEWFRSHPEHTVTSVEELLRYDAALQIINRTVLEEAEIGGHPLVPGDEVFMLLGAGNRDPEVFEEADRLDLSRKQIRNFGFGHGIHFCVAAPVARLATQVVLSELVRHDIELATDTPATNGALAIRSLAELPVILR